MVGGEEKGVRKIKVRGEGDGGNEKERERESAGGLIFNVINEL